MWGVVFAKHQVFSATGVDFSQSIDAIEYAFLFFLQTLTVAAFAWNNIFYLSFLDICQSGLNLKYF